MLSLATNQSLRQVLSECKSALDEEIRAAKKTPASRIYLSDGRLLSSRQTSDGSKFIYSFSADSEIKFPDDSPIEVKVSGRDISGELVSSAGFDVVIALSADLGKEVPQASLSSTPWFLLDRLKLRLDELLANQGSMLLLEQLLELKSLTRPAHRPECDTIINRMAARLGDEFRCNSEQKAAIQKVATSPVSMIWGPPGTGKTNTLGAAANVLLGFGDSVLVCAHSNAAVDRAAVAIAKYLPASLYESGRILRIGISTDEELQQYPMMTVRGVLAAREPQTIKQLETLETRLRDLTKRSRTASLPQQEKERLQADIQAIKVLLDPLRVQLKEAERALIENANLILCTLSKATIMQEIFQRRYTTTVIDEASMAFIPHCLFVSSLSTSRTAFFGDFRQLGPISTGNTDLTRRWLGRDIFEVANVVEHLKKQTPDPRMVLLREQYRMHPKISKLVSELFYVRQLKDNAQVATRTKVASDCAPFAGHPLSVCDLSSITARCFTDPESYSSFNVISAIFSIQLAMESLDSTGQSVGIISPYNAQSRLLNRLLRDLEIKAADIKASTVHKFQGSERTTIIFDPVDNAGKQTPGRLMVGGHGSSAMRLTNVAISRAASKFIAVINPDYIATKHGDKTSFGSAMKRVVADGHSLKASFITNSPEHYTMNLDGVQVFRNSSASKPILSKDLLTASQHVSVSWPSQIPSSIVPVDFFQRLPKDALAYFTGAGRESNVFNVKNARVWDNKLKTDYGLIGIDRNIVWIFTSTNSPDSMSIRIALPKTADLLYGFWSLMPERDPGLPMPQENPFGKCQTCNSPTWPDTDWKMIACSRNQNHKPRYFTDRDITLLIRYTGIQCKLCKGQAIGKRGSYGLFVSCANYPSCKWYMPLKDLL